MSKDNNNMVSMQVENSGFRDGLEFILHEGARRLLQLAIEEEVNQFIENYQAITDGSGHRMVVRNGHHQDRTILSSLGPIPIRQPRVDDRKLREIHGEQFSSQLLPKYMRRTPSIDNLLPALYLKGISSQDFPTALASILGEKAKNLSSNVLVRLKQKWEQEYAAWNKRDLSGKRYVYLWADGVYFNVRLDDCSPCILVIIAADDEGNKELLAVMDGERESELSWTELLVDLKNRGLVIPPSLAIADGALGFWAALAKIYPSTLQQRCWVHKTQNLLDKLPKKQHRQAKGMIHEMYLAENYKDAVLAYDKFSVVYRDKYPAVVNCLEKDFDQLFTFYRFPAAQWIHIRTTNPIESTFATVRLRARRTKGCGSRMATLTMVFQLAREAQKRWKRLKGVEWLKDVITGREFIDGKLVNGDEQEQMQNVA